MTEPTDAERDQFEEMMRLETFDDLSRLGDGSYTSYEARVGWIAWQAARRTAAPVVAGEPYGWHYWNNGGASVLHRGPSSRLDADIEASKQYPKAHHVVPLFTTPQPTQPQAGAVPLTAEQRDAMAHAYPAEDLCRWSYRMGVADAEWHHGINGKTK